MAFLYDLVNTLSLEKDDGNKDDGNKDRLDSPVSVAAFDQSHEFHTQDKLPLVGPITPDLPPAAGGDVKRDEDEEHAVGKVLEFTNLEERLGAEERLKRAEGASDSTREGDENASQSSVSFGSIQVREYERVIDSTQMYMGLALGWNYNEKTPFPVKEKNHTKNYASCPHGGDESRMKRTNGNDRFGMLINYGYSRKDLKNAGKEAARFYKQRQREAARSLVVQDEKAKQNAQPKRRTMLRRSSFV